MSRESTRWKRGPFGGVGAVAAGCARAGLGLGLGLASCVSLETAAPRVAELAGGVTASVAALEAGRILYVGRCAKCHAVEPVAKYGAGEWESILPDMAERTKLSVGETAQLRAYVDAALARLGKPGAGR